MNWELVRLSVGAFLTSAGFGGTAAVAAAVIAYKGIQSRLAGDKKMAEQKRDEDLVDDARQRWWDALNLLWEDRRDLADHPVALQDALEALERLVTTEEQSVMMGAISLVLMPSFSDDEEEELSGNPT